MNIELTQGEANALLQLIDIACQAKGMQVAEAAVVLTKKIHLASIPEVTLDPAETKPE